MELFQTQFWLCPPRWQRPNIATFPSPGMCKTSRQDFKEGLPKTGFAALHQKKINPKGILRESFDVLGVSHTLPPGIRWELLAPHFKPKEKGFSWTT